MNNRFYDRVCIAINPIFGKDYQNYWLKETSKFECKSGIYYNIKTYSKILEEIINKLVELRPKLKMIKGNNYLKPW